MYLGSKRTSDGRSLPAVMRHIGLSSAATSSLKKVWNNRQLSTGTKVHIYRAPVHPPLCMTDMTLLAADIRRLEAFHMRRLQQLVYITWRDYITSEATLMTTGLTPLQDILSKRTASLFGHVALLNPDVPAQKSYGYRRTSPLVGSPMSDGDGHLVDHERLGAARSGLTSECHLVTASWTDPLPLCDRTPGRKHPRYWDLRTLRAPANIVSASSLQACIVLT